jgi:hypothetical protein
VREPAETHADRWAKEIRIIGPDEVHVHFFTSGEFCRAQFVNQGLKPVAQLRLPIVSQSFNAVKGSYRSEGKCPFWWDPVLDLKGD